MANALAYSPEQRELAALSRRMITDHRKAVVANLQDASAPTHVAELWQDMLDSGLIGLAFGADVGGGGGTWADQAVVFREAGRGLVPSTLFSTVFAALVVDRLGTADQRSTVLGDLLASGRIATVAASALWANCDASVLGTTLER